MATRILPALASLLLAGCAGALFGIVNTGTPRVGIAPGPSVDFAPDRGLALDVYRPDRPARDAPIVVFFYGGSWQNGSRGRYAFAGRALAARGLVAVVPDYRLYPAVRFPAFMEDAADAVAWARANAAALGGDPSRLFVMGHSAGAQIAALLATDERWLARAGLPPRALAGAIAVSGPHDVHPEGYPELEDLFGPRAQWPQARPVRFVDGGEPPFLLLHGADDDTVWPSQSEALAGRLRAAGVPVELHLYPGVGHVRPLLALRWPRLAPVLDDTLRFVGGGALARRDAEREQGGGRPGEGRPPGGAAAIGGGREPRLSGTRRVDGPRGNPRHRDRDASARRSEAPAAGWTALYAPAIHQSNGLSRSD